MTIAIPLVGDRLSAHFGHCEEFALVHADGGKEGVLRLETVTPPPHAPVVFPQWLAQLGVQVVIVGGMGSRAQSLFAQQGITVVTGAPVDTAEVLAQAYLSGSLQSGENVCDH